MFRYRVEIAGIDVTSDLVGSPSVSEMLDPGHYQRVSSERCGDHTAERRAVNITARWRVISGKRTDSTLAASRTP